MTSMELYTLKQEFIGYLKSIKSDVEYTIKRSNSTWTNTAISAANELLELLDVYREELTYHRDTLQEGLDKLDVPVYDEYLMEEEVA